MKFKTGQIAMFQGQHVKVVSGEENKHGNFYLVEMARSCFTVEEKELSTIERKSVSKSNHRP